MYVSTKCISDMIEMYALTDHLHSLCILKSKIYEKTTETVDFFKGRHLKKVIAKINIFIQRIHDLESAKVVELTVVLDTVKNKKNLTRIIDGIYDVLPRNLSCTKIDAANKISDKGSVFLLTGGLCDLSVESLY